MQKLSVFQFLKLSKNLKHRSHDEESNAPLISNKVSMSQMVANIPYNPDLYPPDISQCEQHAIARRVSFPQHLYDKMMGRSQSKGEPINVCDCCGYPVENQLIPLCCNTKDLLFLGSGFPLFFEFIKYGIGMLLVIMAIAGCYNISTNVQSDDCNNKLEIHEKPCLRDPFTATSLVNKALHEQFLKYQAILNLISVLFCIVFMQVLRYKQRKLAFKCDLSIITASDYTLQIGNLPNNLDENRLIEFLEKIPTKNREQIKVVKVNLSYFISNYMNLLYQHDSLSDQVLNLQSIQEHLDDEIKKIKDEEELEKHRISLQKTQNDIETTKKELKMVEDKIDSSLSNIKTSCVFTGTVFVTFQTPLQAQLVKSFFRLSTFSKFKRSIDKTLNRESKYLFEGKSIIVERAPEPNEILWENLGVSDAFRLKQKLWTWSLTILSLFLSFVAITLIFYFQVYTYEHSDSTFIKSVVSYTGCFVIVIINNGLVYLVTILTKKEKLENVTEYDISLTEKKTVAVFLNTACIYLLVAFWTNTYFGSNGLIYNVISVFLSNMVMQPLLFLFSPFYLLKIYKQRKMRLDPKAYRITQQQANKIFEGAEFEITVCYAGVLNIMLFGAFYAPLLPLSLILAITTLTIYYWIFKYIILRRSSTPTFLGKEIGYEAIEIMEFVPLFLGLGDVLFNLIFYGESGMVNYVTVGIAVFNFLFPMGWLNKIILPFEEKKKKREESLSNTLPYNEARVDFNEDYDRSNPMTQEKATDEWIEFKEGRAVGEQNVKETVKEGFEQDKRGEERQEKVKRSRMPIPQGKMKTEIEIVPEDHLGGIKKYVANKKKVKKGLIARNWG